MSTQEKSKDELIREMRGKREARARRKKRKKATAVIAVITMLTVTAGAVLTVSAKEISITEIDEFNGTSETKTYYTLQDSSVGDILSKNNVSVTENDKINLSVDKEITDDEAIVITRGKEITIVADGVERGAVVTKANAHDALIEAGYIPSETDEITVNSGADLTSGDRIEFVTVSNTEDVATEEISQDTEYVDDPDLPEGETRVVDEGQAGVREIRSNVIYRSGEEFYREVVSDTMTAEPQNTVIAVGTKKPDPTPASTVTNPEPVVTDPAPSGSVSVSDSAGTIDGMSYSQKITMTATAYSTSPSENGGYTVSAMGNPLGYGIVAVDPSVIPLGSKVYVTSDDGSWTYGIASAEDTGGAIKGKRIDLCYEGSVSSVNNFGRRSCVVYVLD